MATAKTVELERLNERLLHGDINMQAAAAAKLATMDDEVDIDWIFTIHDQYWTPVSEFGGDLMEASGNDPQNDKAAAAFKIKGRSELAAVMKKSRDTLVGITLETGGQRFAYYVNTHKRAYAKAAWTSEAACLGVWDILNYYRIFPTWWLPIQAQPFSHAIFVGSLVTVIENMIQECALRIQLGINEFLNNALSLNLDMRTWFATILQSSGNVFEMLKTPLYVVRTNPFLDTSPQVARTVRMESCGEVIRDLTKAYGVDVRVDLWKPGDAQPDQWANLTKPTYVVTVKDRSQIEGPTKTVLDSILRTTVDLGGSLGDIFKPIIREVNSMPGVYEAPGLGVYFQEPYAIVIAPEEGEDGPLTSCEITDHTPKGWQIIIGGKSPKWLNDLINATLAWLIDSVMILVGFTGIPSNLLDGFLNDAFLAFQMLQHYDRRAQMGPMHPNIEVFIATNTAPYNVEAIFTFLTALWETRGYTSAQFTFKNAPFGPYRLGRDIFRGGLVSLVYPVPGQGLEMLTDYVTDTPWRYTPKEREIVVMVGDNKADEAPIAKHQRNITGLQEAFNVATLAPRS